MERIEFWFNIRILFLLPCIYQHNNKMLFNWLFFKIIFVRQEDIYPKFIYPKHLFHKSLKIYRKLFLSINTMSHTIEVPNILIIFNTGCNDYRNYANLNLIFLKWTIALSFDNGLGL